MFDILPSSAVPSEVELSESLEGAKQAAHKIFKDLPKSEEREAFLRALGRIGKSGLKQKIRHRARQLLDAVGAQFPELLTVTDEAVNCRNFFVHGGKPRFDYDANPTCFSFLVDTLEFVFATSDLIEAGWDVKTWSTIPSGMSHPFGGFRVDYRAKLTKLKALL